MTIATSKPKTYTAEEYLALEVESELRHEYQAGEIVEMAGGTPAHNKLSSALNALLWFGLRKKPYTVFVTDQRLWIPVIDLYTYPDVMVVADPLGLKPGRKDTVINPILIAKTLSRSTQNYDRGDKFVHYRTIETFQDYVLIDQYRPFVEHHVKQSEHQWLLTEYQGLNASFELVSVPVEIALADLYEGIEFETSEESRGEVS
ncbi:Uma2 family endonuclease [Leptothoe sp. EHU-05/26/07-4]|uniref:Uma2 family endonuclease n=1 Tax=Adonisia turfae CCMR0081 TaxID=2292702 RepID=A0A6M0RHA8_9CYAN|nr:Uma2 family endonuclease [Adonisia turfae]NEZ55608.1 Uma2 family endonuclease [Adonisia turfae CCMR0081]